MIDGRSRSHREGPWQVDVTVRPVVADRVPGSRIALVRAIAAALDAAGAAPPASIGLILTADAELAILNETHLGQAGPTDVLSFPLLPPAAFPPHPGRSDAADPTPAVFVLPPRARPHLGDIVVSVDRAIDQATEGRGGQTGDVRSAPADELRLLVTHGALHICGWDHADPVEERAMRDLERRLLDGAAR